MLPAVISNLIWGSLKTNEEPKKHVTDDAGDWLVVEHQDTGPQPEGGSDADSRSQVNSDDESVCSEASWVVAPAPRFRGSLGTEGSRQNHPFENLLIEHPAMSVYGHVPKQNIATEPAVPVDTTPAETQVTDNNSSGAETRLLTRDHQRQQLALHLNVPPKAPVRVKRMVQSKHPKLSRRSLARHNENVVKMPRAQNCGYKGGRRGC